MTRGISRDSIRESPARAIHLESIEEMKLRRKMSIIFYREARCRPARNQPEMPEMPFKVFSADTAGANGRIRSRNDSASSFDFRYFRAKRPGVGFARSPTKTRVDPPEIR